MMILTSFIFDVWGAFSSQWFATGSFGLLASSLLRDFDLVCLIFLRFFLLKDKWTIPPQSFDRFHTILSLCGGSRLRKE